MFDDPVGQSAPMLCENHYETILKMIAYRLGVPMSVVFVFLFQTLVIEKILLFKVCFACSIRTRPKQY